MLANANTTNCYITLIVGSALCVLLSSCPQTDVTYKSYCSGIIHFLFGLPSPYIFLFPYAVILTHLHFGPRIIYYVK